MSKFLSSLPKLMILQMMVINFPVENSMGFSCMEVMMKKWKAILFDMDGTLFDTEQISRIAWLATMERFHLPKAGHIF